jgi:hypothetical protein
MALFCYLLLTYLPNTKDAIVDTIAFKKCTTKSIFIVTNNVFRRGSRFEGKDYSSSRHFPWGKIIQALPRSKRKQGTVTCLPFKR